MSSGSLFTNSGDRPAWFISDASCWSRRSEHVMQKLPIIAVLKQGLLFAVSAARQRTEWPKKIECPVSQQSSLFPEKPCMSGRVKHGMGRGTLLLFCICCPCWLSTVEAFISCRGRTGAFPSSEFTYKREHMNCSFISHPSCLRGGCIK